MLITEAQGYKLYCEVTPVDFPPGLHKVHIFTRSDWANDPAATQTKIELFFDTAALDAFRSALQVPNPNQ
jgi:hypothetical protein